MTVQIGPGGGQASSGSAAAMAEFLRTHSGHYSIVLIGDYRVTGSFRSAAMLLPTAIVVNASVHADAAVTRSKLANEQRSYSIPIHSWRNPDDFDTAIWIPSDTELGMRASVFGTDSPALVTDPLNRIGSIDTPKARALFILPPEYEAGQPVTFQASASMFQGVLADNLCTVDVEIYKSNRETGITGTDLIMTDEQNMNTHIQRLYRFALNANDLMPGDMLDILIGMRGGDNDSTAAGVKGEITHTDMLVTIKG